MNCAKINLGDSCRFLPNKQPMRSDRLGSGTRSRAHSKATVAGGLYGERPGLGHLYDDNLNFTTGFQTVYATVFDEWLGASSEAILGQKRLDTLPILSAP